MQARATTLHLFAGALGVLAGLQSATAQLRAPAAALLDPLPLRHSVAATAEPLAQSPAGALSSASRAPAARRSAWEITASRISLIELPTYGITPERTRPGYALGFSSQTMRNWMNDLGVDTGSCTAPIIRLRTRVDAGGDFRGALWVHARCSLW